MQDTIYRTFLKWVSSKESSEKFLIMKGVIKKYDKCIYCGGKNLGRIRRDRYKCYSCRREWSPYRGTVFEKFRIDPQKLLIILKLFELEVKPELASKEAEINLKTARKLYRYFREKIFEYIKRKKSMEVLI